ncbi:MAG TPA: acetyltransferase [Chitinophagaceae bacterium]|jgi:sugar O-acyltransferase (sialic acid O-acetyltransferase NeuD family)|nr:acetyltransferase [Chitinophagaceae bacterium]
MIIAGAGGHAKEIFTELQWLQWKGEISFFDDVNPTKEQLLGMPLLTTEAALKSAMQKDNLFIVGTGKPLAREILYNKMLAQGGQVYSIISRYAVVGTTEVYYGEGVNIMSGAVITTHVTMGKCVLVNTHASIHHDSVIGDFCELSPGCRILGNVQIGHCTSVGTNAVILPGITVGSHVKVGAGAVVTKNVPDGVVVKGMPGSW